MARLSFVTLCQPMSRKHNAEFEVHTYLDQRAGLHPGDVNWSGFDDADTDIVFEIGNLPEGSEVRIQPALADSSPCSDPNQRPGDNGHRLVVDIWVTPRLNGALRRERYLGYAMYQHVDHAAREELFLAVGPKGLASALVGKVWGTAETPHVEGCWFGPHIHTVAIRDRNLEQRDGTYTIDVQERWSDGMHPDLHRGSELYRWVVDWDR
ncbi:MAG: hypothetical protein ACKVVT_11820 [Dehalococcoidia bacterium]